MVIDIKFMNDKAYLLKQHSLSAEEFEHQISKIQYATAYEPYKTVKDETGVEKTHFPSINIVFYKYIFEMGKVPYPETLIDEYFDYYHDLIEIDSAYVHYISKRFSYDAVVGRILRSYPSLIRDFDFFLKLNESHCFDQVIYSCQLDISGKDIILRKNGKEYVLSLFVDTSRSNFFKTIKNRYRHKYNSNEIQLPLKLQNAQKCGDIYIYDASYVEQVCSEISKRN